MANFKLQSKNWRQKSGDDSAPLIERITKL